MWSLMKYVVLFILLMCMVLSVSANDIPLDWETYSGTQSIAGFGDLIRTVIAQNVILSDRNELLKEQNRLMEDQNKLLFIQTCAPSSIGLTNVGKLCYDMGFYEKYNISVTKNW
jgi:hypothetical protein